MYKNSVWMGVPGYTSDLKTLIEVTSRLHKAESVDQCAEISLKGACHIASAEEGRLKLTDGCSFDHQSTSVQSRADIESYFDQKLEPVLLMESEITGFNPATGHSMILIPVVGRDEKLHGVLQLGSPKRDAFSPKQICTLKSLALSVAIALENLTAEKLAIKSLKSETVDLLRVELKESENANLAKDQYLASISHEIRNPLGVMLGLTQIALETPALCSETRQLLMAIQRNGQQVEKILGKVLDISKIEAGCLDLELMKIDLASFLKEIACDSESATKAGVEFNFNISPDLPEQIVTDPTRLRQILMNLLGNAHKFTSEGAIDFEVALGTLSFEPKSQAVIFKVRDTGIGISDEHQRFLFRSFSQVEPSTARRFGGTGLGLMISKKMAKALGGELVLESSRAGLGSEFKLEIPAEKHIRQT